MSIKKDNLNENVPLVGGLTPSEIEKLKRTNKTDSVFLITVKTEDKETLFFWFKKIDMAAFSAASTFMEKDPLQAAQIIFNNTLIQGSKEAAKEVAVFAAISAPLIESIGTASATLKKF